MSSNNKGAVVKTAPNKQTTHTNTPPPYLDALHVTRLHYNKRTKVRIYAPTLPKPRCGLEPVSFSSRKYKRHILITLHVWWQLATPFLLNLINYHQLYDHIYEHWFGMRLNNDRFVQEIMDIIPWKRIRKEVKNLTDLKVAMIATLHKLYKMVKATTKGYYNFN
eukprot:138436_1